jgi:hypothetical protein
LNSGHGRVSQHDKRDVPVPAMPGSALVMAEAEFFLCGLEAFLDTPARSFDPNEALD